MNAAICRAISVAGQGSILPQQLGGVAVDSWSGSAVMDLLRPNVEHAVSARVGVMLAGRGGDSCAAYHEFQQPRGHCSFSFAQG